VLEVLRVPARPARACEGYDVPRRGDAAQDPRCLEDRAGAVGSARERTSGNLEREPAIVLQDLEDVEAAPLVDLSENAHRGECYLSRTERPADPHGQATARTRAACCSGGCPACGYPFLAE